MNGVRLRWFAVALMAGVGVFVLWIGSERQDVQAPRAHGSSRAVKVGDIDAQSVAERALAAAGGLHAEREPAEATVDGTQLEQAKRAVELRRLALKRIDEELALVDPEGRRAKHLQATKEVAQRTLSMREQELERWKPSSIATE